MSRTRKIEQAERAAGPEQSAFAMAVCQGLARPQKTLPCRYFYDAAGSELFEQITELPEYYPTRTEAGILAAHAAEMAAGVPEGSVLVELGSGSSVKTEILLRELPGLAAYVPLDVSPSALDGAKRRLASRFPALDVHPIVGDFWHPVQFPAHLAGRAKTGFFPGSTIGNLTPVEAVRLLSVVRSSLGRGSRLIIGVDLRKDEGVLVRAYDDAAGVTAAFNLNLLARINRELGGTFDLDAFRHRALYNRRDGRIEMHLVSTRDQGASVCGRAFRFAADETIHTENSYKYSLEQFRDLAGSAGWTAGRVWTDAERLFSVHELLG